MPVSRMNEAQAIRSCGSAKTRSTRSAWRNVRQTRSRKSGSSADGAQSRRRMLITRSASLPCDRAVSSPRTKVLGSMAERTYAKQAGAECAAEHQQDRADCEQVAGLEAREAAAHVQGKCRGEGKSHGSHERQVRPGYRSRRTLQRVRANRHRRSARRTDRQAASSGGGRRCRHSRCHRSGDRRRPPLRSGEALHRLLRRPRP